jgi:hypothetical protein
VAEAWGNSLSDCFIETDEAGERTAHIWWSNKCRFQSSVCGSTSQQENSNSNNMSISGSLARCPQRLRWSPQHPPRIESVSLETSTPPQSRNVQHHRDQRPPPLRHTRDDLRSWDCTMLLQALDPRASSFLIRRLRSSPLLMITACSTRTM